MTGGDAGEFTVGDLIGGWDGADRVLAIEPDDMWVEMAAGPVARPAPALAAVASVPRPGESDAGRWPGGGGDRELAGYMAAR